ncbi:MAG: DUF1295 domain-containing protein [Dehalococcoidales bacterium]|nr:MAG: DUF1295 domain-containing protein [Dehalococcoidales bacterium]
MSETTFRYILFGWILIAVVVFIVLLFIAAPYGRHFRKNFGPSVNAKLGWILMESPAPLVFAIFFIIGVNPLSVVPILFLLMWQIHYLDRAFICPLTIRLSSKPLPYTVMTAGILFNGLNAYLNSYYISMNLPKYSTDWLSDIRFLSGIGLFIFGFLINRQSDYILYRIRQNTGQEYGIPENGLYRWISCPNYLGEILIWLGWTVATWSPVAAAFSLWSIANLVPRARSHHRWYKETFEDYPDKRHILLPWLW